MAARKKILVVDDDDMVIVYLDKKLANRYDLVATTEPGAAMKLALSEKPDLVLCDIDMPGISGGDLAASFAARPETANIPFMFLTSIVSPEEARELDGMVGGRPGVAKRAPLAELLSKIEKLVH